MQAQRYLMENGDESLRLDIKTDNEVTARQATWAGIAPGMRVADIGCGSGKTTSKLGELVQPGGSALGIDIAEQRVAFGQENYQSDFVSFLHRDARPPMNDLGFFDFVWVRFLLEYHRANSYDLAKNISDIVEPGGTLVLIDLDYNCLTHFGHSDRMEKALAAVMKSLEGRANFDPYVGRKLYSYLYDMGYEDIRVDVGAHHQIFGELRHADDFNWTKKVEIGARFSGYDFAEYENGFEEFLAEFRTFFAHPRRFTYTPIIAVSGRKPAPSP